MASINYEINMKTLSALKRTYSTLFELYEYAIHHDLPIDHTEDVLIRRSLGELVDASEKILSHINLNAYNDSMFMYVRTALSSVRNSLSVLNSLLEIEKEVERRMANQSIPIDQSSEFNVYAEKLKIAVDEANRTADVLKSRLEEGY